MSADAAMAISWFFTTGWRFLTSFNIPGTQFTPLQGIFMIAFVDIIVKVIRAFISRGSSGRAVRPPSGSTTGKYGS